MDITFVVTGKAGKSGHEQWKKVYDEDYSTRIYSHSKREAFETSRLEIELREYKGSVFTYYTYLIVKNVAQVKSKEDEERHEKHGRTGSFFGMTIKIKGGYIANVSQLYDLFENVFDQRIRGIILTDENTDGYLTFLIEKLSDGEDAFVLAEKDILSAVSTMEMRNLPTNCVTQQMKSGEVKTKLFNVEDTAHSSFLQALFYDAEVNVSREYETFEKVETRRRQAAERKKKEEEKAVISEQSSNQTPVSSDRCRGSSSSSNVTNETSSLQTQTVSVRSDMFSSQNDNSSQAGDLYNKLLLKFISIVFETCKLLLSFIAQQKTDKKSGVKINSELQEYEIKLHQISKELEEIKKSRVLADDAQHDGFSLFNFKKFDYKLIIPLGIILVIIIALFKGMYNPNDEPLSTIGVKADSVSTIGIQTNIKSGDSIHITEIANADKSEKTSLSSNTSADTPIHSSLLKYKVKTSANMRKTPVPDDDNNKICTLSKDALFYVSKDTLDGTWVYGETEDKRQGYIKKSLLKEDR